MKLNSIILIPVVMSQNVLNLNYSKIKANAIEIDKVVKIQVNESASPLFYKIDKVEKVKKIFMSGKVNIEKEIGDNLDDSYFQLGIIYEGDYRPNFFIKKFLPEWLLKVLSLGKSVGVSEIEFLEVSDGRMINRADKIQGISLTYKNIAVLKNESFEFTYTPKDKRIIAFWLRSDGDDSKAKFKVELERFELD